MIRRIGIVVLVFYIAVTSCQKELHFDYSNLSEGTLKSNTMGDCMPSLVNGTYIANTVPGSENYIEVQVNITLTGIYNIQSDTINGYHFQANGVFTKEGLNTVRLFVEGTPINAGIDLFTIKYGSSFCKINIPVLDSAGNSLFFLGGSPGNCSGAIVNGIYKQGSPLNPGNIVVLEVNVITTGPYNVVTDTINGISFSSSGTFTQTGMQHISLAGSGVPVTAGSFNFTAINAYSNCTFSITVANAAPAAFVLGGAPNFCTGVSIAGNYIIGIPLSASNTASIDVTVTSIGSYTISAPVVNGVTFSKTGFFNTTGSQTVVLNASGTPLATGTNNHVVSGGGSSCTFSVNYLAVPPQAFYALSGGPGQCSPFVLTGNYIVGVPLTSANKLTLEVDVTTTGSYICSTPLINGIYFQTSGIFTSTGLQTITLPGVGTPLAASTFTFTPQTGVTSVCRFDLTTFPGSSDILSCKINSAPANFNNLATAISTTSPNSLSISGNVSSGSIEKLSLKISKTTGSITAGTYTNADISSGVSLFVKYDDPSSGSWEASSTAATPFSITITTISSTRAIGTFHGTLKNNNGTGPGSKTITEGAFDVPVN